MSVATEAKETETTVQELVDNFREIIPKSKKLAEDAEAFCDSIEEELKTMETEEADYDTIEDFARFLRDMILDQEPDATLRQKLETFTTLIIVDKVPLNDLPGRI